MALAAGKLLSAALISLFFSITVLCSPVKAEFLPRGVNRAKGSFYKPGTPFTCLDGSQTLPFTYINDDYCDCADGSDEPGTAACPNGKFYCINKGYRPELIPSSRVSDGICDCCDGSDEYEGKVTCRNTCEELGRAIREEQLAMKKLVEEGHRIRSEYALQGESAIADKHKELVNLGPLREQLKTKKDELSLKKAEAEEPEKAGKEEFEKWWKEEVAKMEEENNRLKASNAFKELDTNQDGLVSLNELLLRNELDKDKDGTVTEDEAKSYMSGYDSVDQNVFITTIWTNVKEVIVIASPEPVTTSEPPTAEERPPVPDTESAETEKSESDSDDDSDFEEDDSDDKEDDEDKKKVPSDSKELPPYPDDIQALIDTANVAREAYNQAEKEYNDIDRQIQDLEKVLALDLGPNKVFYPLKDQCFEYTDREYTYKFCPYDKASQRPKNGGSETNLGTFSRWEANGDDKHGFMKFEKGLNCWNGPDRSATVKFSCGKENALTSAVEPSRCEYAFTFETPAACHTIPEVSAEGSYHHEEL